MLEHLKRKIEADNKAKATNPCKRTTIIIGRDGKARAVTERISYEEWLEDQEDYEDNPEDPSFRAEMEGEW